MKTIPWLIRLVALSSGLWALAGAAGQADLPSPAELELAGLDPSEAEVLAGNEDPATFRELVLRLAWRARNFTQSNILPAVRAGLDVEDGGDADRLPLRFRLVKVEGTMLEAGRWNELDPAAEPAFWRLKLQTARGNPVLIVASQVPSAWTDGSLPVSGIRAAGFLVGEATGEWLEGSGPGGIPVIACDRVEWFPEDGTAGPSVPRPVMMLARHGFDAGLLDQIRRAGARPLGAGELEAWRGMVRGVAALGDAEWNELERRNDVADVGQLLRQPDRIIARPVALRGTLRRVSAPAVDRAEGLEVRQLDLVVSVGTDRVAITNTAGERMEFGSRIPVTVIIDAARWSGTLETGSVVEVRGLAYRFWTYESGLSREQGALAGQTLPLVIGWEVRPVETGRETVDRVLYGLLLGLLGLIALVGLSVGWLNRRDRRSEKPRQLLPERAPEIRLPE